MTKNIADQIKDYALKNGAKLVGIADSRLLDKKAPRGHRPQDILSDAKSVIVVAVPQPRGIISDSLPTEYTRCIYTAEIKLELLTFDISNIIDEKGYKSIPIPVKMEYSMDVEKLMGDISHKHAAVYAGLGQIGKNSLLITPEYGNRVYLASIVTNAPMSYDIPFKKQFCDKECQKCIEACPVRAIPKDGSALIDKMKCYLYCKTQKERYPITKGLYSCRECRRVCPFSKV
jgi:epoxyqueuosine reductase QueG